MQNPDQIIFAAEKHMTLLLMNDSSGHDLWHIKRVVGLSHLINKEERGDPFIVALGAWLHDIADHKFHRGDETAGPKAAEKWMQSIGVDEKIIVEVSQIVKEISFKGAGVSTPMSTREGQIVQDADRLDAIGAIGIARTFAYGGFKGHAICDPDIEAEMHESFDTYKKGKAPVINHFHEKLLLLKNRMNTKTAKRLALKRHAFMLDYLEQFDNEWNESLST